jgi:hypothetical protein
MCLFITAVVPDEALTRAFAEVTKKHQLSFAACENRHLQAQLRGSEQYVHTTAAYCDCGSPLFTKSNARPQENLARELAKLRRKGWSEAKIIRWSDSTAQRPVDPHAAPKGQRSVHDWAEFLREVLNLRSVSYIGLVGHSYSGDVSTEEFTLSGRTRHVVDVLGAGGFEVLEEDVVHEFRLSRREAV